MRQVLKVFLVVTIIASCPLVYSCCGPSGCGFRTCCDSCDFDCNNCCIRPCDGYPFLAHRSQSVNAARELVGWQPFINKYGMEKYYGAFSVAVEYSRTFREEQLAQFLFGCDLQNCNTLFVQGSMVEDRNETAWLADYFGLPRDFESKVRFCPRIENAIVDLNFYVGLDELVKGLYFRIHAPIVWTRWRLNMSECVIEPGSETVGRFPEGYMAADEIPVENLSKNFIQAVSGCHTFGDMRETMHFGIMTNCKLSKTRLSDIQAALGWNFLLEQDYHFGLSLRAAAPTGNRPQGIYLFEPIVGNGKHWELGVGISGSAIFWRSKENKDRMFGVWLEGNITHLFKADQCRSFDLCGKPNSRYMLLEQMEVNAANDEQQEQVKGDNPVIPAKYRYAKNIIPAINWSTFKVDVSIDVQADLALKLAYIRENCSFDVGYNLWARTGEEICYNFDNCDDCCCCCPTDPGKIYAIKGDAFVYGYPDGGQVADAKPLSATQSEATIYSGKNAPTDIENVSLNPSIDNGQPAESQTENPLFDFGNTGQVNTSIQPKLVTCADWNMCNSPSALTHKVFAHFNYIWTEREESWTPFLGIGGEAEFGTNNKKNNKNCCDNGNCKKKAGISQWGVWIKGGVSFD